MVLIRMVLITSSTILLQLRGVSTRRRIASADAAAAEKVAAGESRAVEHVAEWEVGLDQVEDAGGGEAAPEPLTVVAKRRGRRAA